GPRCPDSGAGHGPAWPPGGLCGGQSTGEVCGGGLLAIALQHPTVAGLHQYGDRADVFLAVRSEDGGLLWCGVEPDRHRRLQPAALTHVCACLLLSASSRAVLWAFLTMPDTRTQDNTERKAEGPSAPSSPG